MSNLVQPIIVCVNESTTHHDAILAASKASVQSYQHESLRWDYWLNSLFTKTVRRAKPAEFNRIVVTSREWGHQFALAESNDSRAIAFEPMEYDEFPKLLKKCQVSGLAFPKNTPTTVYNETDVLVDSRLAMSTGKTAAQVAHAAWKLQLKDVYDPKTFDFVELTGEAFENALDAVATDLIVDSGLTEIAENSITVIIQ